MHSRLRVAESDREDGAKPADHRAARDARLQPADARDNHGFGARHRDARASRLPQRRILCHPRHHHRDCGIGDGGRRAGRRRADRRDAARRLHDGSAVARQGHVHAAARARPHVEPRDRQPVLACTRGAARESRCGGRAASWVGQPGGSAPLDAEQLAARAGRRGRRRGRLPDGPLAAALPGGLAPLLRIRAPALQGRSLRL